MDESLKEFINNEFINHSAESNIICNYTSFNFIAKDENEVIGILKCHACYEDAYIDDLIVVESHRRKGLGMKLIKKQKIIVKTTVLEISVYGQINFRILLNFMKSVASNLNSQEKMKKIQNSQNIFL